MVLAPLALALQNARWTKQFLEEVLAQLGHALLFGARLLERQVADPVFEACCGRILGAPGNPRVAREPIDQPGFERIPRPDLNMERQAAGFKLGGIFAGQHVRPGSHAVRKRVITCACLAGLGARALTLAAIDAAGLRGARLRFGARRATAWSRERPDLDLDFVFLAVCLGW